MALTGVVVVVLVSLLFGSSVIIGTLSTTPYGKVCHGTSNTLSFSKTEDAEIRYNRLKERYKDCTYIDGNLEIVAFNCGESMSFLRSIEEITGYLLIVNTCSERIPLTNLRIIRGRTLYETHNSLESNRTRNYSLYVAYNYRDLGNDTKPEEGMTSLVLAKLTEISAGSVLFQNNPLLCFVDTIDWSDILAGEGAKVIIGPQGTANATDCGQCSTKCNKSTQVVTRHCWTRQHCQNFTRVICAKQCSGRCFGKDANECCHIECAAGCTGPLDTDCHSCKNFNDAKRCVPFCPPLEKYDPLLKKYVLNPGVKYAYGSQCVEECPKHMMVDKGACVSDCGRDYYADGDRKCRPCGDDPCPKSCPGTGHLDWVHAHNIHSFINCTVIQGSLKIQQTTFEGDNERNIPGLTVNDLSALENIIEITDFLTVDTHVEELRNLSFLKNLKIIHGRNLDRGVHALKILGTKLEILDLNSLRQVSHGRVLIHKNFHLCLVDTFNWTQLVVNPTPQMVEVSNNGNFTICESNGLVCSAECTSDGCMGPAADQCFKCANYRFGSTCIESCAVHRHPYLVVQPNSTECIACHEECLGGCTGAGIDQCIDCRHVREGDTCVPNCSERHYADTEGICRPCSPLCVGGCRGPDAAISKTGCKRCRHVIDRESESSNRSDGTVDECLSEDTPCPSDYYMYKITPHQTSMIIKSGCKRCDRECLSCDGSGPKRCRECRNFKQDGICMASCSSTAYYADDARQCHKCHDECLECRGPTASDCLACRLYVVYEDFAERKPDSKFNCTDICPEFAANKLREGNTTFCVPDEFVNKQDGKKLVAIIAGTICGGVFFVGFVAVIILILRRQVARAEEKRLRLTAKISGFVECEPLTPSNAKPDMAVLRLIKESDLRRSGIIGSGAFGTVYKGLWVPEGENVKIPVAIKVLQEGADENDNLLEEARIMASVLHPSCLHILAVCMTAQVMLVTQLMPLGCLLDYVRKHRDNIGSKVMLNWCTQIARGMSYLEERGIIHRDLAARNVLVHSPSHVKITDFGLAKLVSEDGRFLSTGGKLPIKWLALECIRNRIFTHKSDVWSFGVTVWELCTYGQRPYENVNAGDIVNLLEKGERLPQPSICTIDVYMIMIKCWMLGAESRPSFSELAEEFAKMARDPGRYLVIPNDKLMRLPSQPADSRELLRHVSLTLDGPEEVIMADEYVNEHAKKTRFRLMDKYPRDGRQTPIDEEPTKPTSISAGASAAAAGSTSVSRSQDDPKTPDTKSPNSRTRLVPHLELASVQNRLSSYEANRDSPRYSPDPCSMPQAAFPNAREDAVDGQPPAGEDGSMPLPPPPSEGTVKKDDPETLRIPLDESDYLQPRSLVPTSYLELVDGGGGTDEALQGDYSPLPERTDALPDERTSLLPKTTAIENPEYFQPTNTTPLLVGQVR